MSIQTEITRHTDNDRLRGHRHEKAYVALILDGGYYELSVDGVWLCEAGDIVIHPSHHFHSNRFTRGTKVLNLSISCAESEGDEFMSYSVLTSTSSGEILRFDTDVEALREILQSATAKSKHLDDWVTLMANDLSSDPTTRISDLADRYSVTAEHASRAFRERFSVTPSVFRFESRFQHAMRLLREERHSLSDIALISGYCDQAHFCRDFRTITGLSPSTFRRHAS